MSLALRLVLLISSIGCMVFITKGIRKSRLQMSDAIFWVLLAILLILNAIFPNIGHFFSSLFGFMETSNFIFTFFIAILLLKEFLNASEISSLRYKVNQLTQELALEEYKTRNHIDD